MVSDQDPWVWLATGRQAIPPGRFDPLWRYHRETRSADLETALGEARRLGARWLLVSLGWNEEFQALWDEPLRLQPRWPQHR